MEQVVYNFGSKKEHQLNVNIIFKNHYMLIDKRIFIFLSLFVIINFRGTCSSIEMLKGYMARESLGSPGIEPFAAFSFACLSWQ